PGIHQVHAGPEVAIYQTGKGPEPGLPLIPRSLEVTDYCRARIQTRRLDAGVRSHEIEFDRPLPFRVHLPRLRSQAHSLRNLRRVTTLGPPAALVPTCQNKCEALRGKVDCGVAPLRVVCDPRINLSPVLSEIKRAVTNHAPGACHSLRGKRARFLRGC